MPAPSISIRDPTLTFTGYETLSGTVSGLGNVTFKTGAFTVSGDYNLGGTTQVFGSGVTVAITYPTSSSSTGPFGVDLGSTLTLKWQPYVRQRGGFQRSRDGRFQVGDTNDKEQLLLNRWGNAGRWRHRGF